jgi:hypothetical protein
LFQLGIDCSAREAALHHRSPEGQEGDPSPVRLDHLLVTLTDAKAETVAYLEVPMEQLPADAP